jgi:hypothetical protein
LLCVPQADALLFCFERDVASFFFSAWHRPCWSVVIVNIVIDDNIRHYFWSVAVLGNLYRAVNM